MTKHIKGQNNFKLNKRPKHTFDLEKDSQSEPTPPHHQANNNAKSWWIVLAVIVVAFFVWVLWPKASEEPGNEAVIPVEQPAARPDSASSRMDETATTGQPTTEEVVVEEEEVPQPASAVTGVVAPSPAGVTSSPVGNIDADADATIRGRYGNGAERRRALGTRYDQVQRRVNQKLRSH